MGQIQSAINSGINTVLAAYMGNQYIEEKDFNRAKGELDKYEADIVEAYKNTDNYDPSNKHGMLAEALRDLDPLDEGKYNKRYNDMYNKLLKGRTKYHDAMAAEAANQSVAEEVEAINEQTTSLNNIVGGLAGINMYNGGVV